MTTTATLAPAIHVMREVGFLLIDTAPPAHVSVHVDMHSATRATVRLHRDDDDAYLTVVLDRLGGGDLVDDHIQSPGEDLECRNRRFKLNLYDGVELITFTKVVPICGGPATGCEQDAEEDHAFGEVRAVNMTVDHGPSCPVALARVSA